MQNRPIIIDDALYIEPITACNLRCKCCYSAYDTLKNAKIIPKATILKFISEYQVLVKTPSITWCGRGEVFLYPDFVELINAVTSSFPNVYNLIQTNGSIMPKPDFININKLDFSISIDGNAEAHDENRGKGSYQKTMNFAEYVYKKGAKSICIRALVTRANILDLERFESEIKMTIGETAFLMLTMPYTNQEVKNSANLDVMRKLPANNLLLPQRKALKTLQKTYSLEFLSRVCPDINDKIYIYPSLMAEGIFNCCEGQKKLADYPVNAADILELQKQCGEKLCLNCSFKNFCVVG